MSLTSAWTRRVLWGVFLTAGFLVLGATSASTAQASGDDPADEILFYRDDGLFRYYDIRSDGSLPGAILGGDGYTPGWDAIVPIDLDGRGQDEILFYRDDGLFRFYNVGADGRIGAPILGGDGYTPGWDSIVAIDLDADGQDEILFYRDDGLFRFYNVGADGRIGAPILGGDGYTPGWDSIVAIDLDGNRDEELLFYDQSGLYRYYDVRPSGSLGRLVAGGDGYTGGWSIIAGIDLQGDLHIERISRFTTFFDCCQPRVTNIRQIAREVNGTVVLPGEVFSINAVTGPRTSAGGYVPAPYLQEGEGQCCAVGGGVSQFGTTMFNAVFWGGLDDVQHQPHSGWISRYPLGIEATLVYSAIDVKFRNDTATPITVRTSSTSTSVTVELWGNQGGWQVTGFHPRGSRNPSVTLLDNGGPNAKRVSGWVTGSAPGQVTVVRRLTQGGSTFTEKWWWFYVS